MMRVLDTEARRKFAAERVSMSRTKDPDFSHDYLRSVISYSPETGIFTWLQGRRAGKTAGSIHNKKSTHSYWNIKFGRQQRVLAHRLAWFYMTGAWPEKLIDHRDCNGLNNRWLNLRNASNSQNAANSRSARGEMKGIQMIQTELWHSLNPHSKKYSVSVCAKHVGNFHSLEEAKQAYAAASKEKFGQFARAGDDCLI